MNKPLPNKPLKRDYRPIKRIARTIPWGYVLDPNDPELLHPVLWMLALMEQAERAFHAQTSTHSAIAQWLSAKSGVPITRVGLRKRIRHGNAILYDATR